MAQPNYTPIQLYRTATASAAPLAGNLTDGELAINTADGKLFYKDSGGTVRTIADVNATAGYFFGTSAAGASIRLYEDTDNGTNYVALKAADSIASNVTWTLPATDGTSGQVLSTNGSGTLSWASAGGSQWTTSGSTIYYTAGNVGIKTTTANAPLAIKGDGSYRCLDLIGVDAATLADERSAIRAYNPAYSSVTGFLQWTNTGTIIGLYPLQPFTINPNNGSGWYEAVRVTPSGNLLLSTTAQLTTNLTHTITKTQSPNSSSTAWADQVGPLVVYGNFGGGGGSQQQSSALTAVGWSSLGAPGAIFRGWWSTNQPSLGTPVLQFQVAANGNVTNTNNSYGSLSDARLKENIVDATPKLDSLNKLRVVNFNLKQDLDKQKQIGLIAQEVEQVFPGLVETDGEGTKSIKYSVLVPMLLKAVQELNAKVETLTAEVNATKGQA